MYEVAAALFQFERTKILIDKMEKNKSYDKAGNKRELYNALVKSYQTDKDCLLLTYPRQRMSTPKKRIIVVTRFTIMKNYDYRHLEEIEVRREDQKMYKFREGITSIMVNGKRVYELKGKILDDLRDNTFNGTNGEDVNNGQEGVADKEFSDAEKANNDDELETAEIFRMETNLFEYETPLCTEFKEFNFLSYKNQIQGPYANYYSNFLDKEEHEDKDKHGLFDDQKRSVCNIRRFKMIKYSFREDEEYVAIKEHEYDDLTSTNEDACHTYQEIFRRMDEGWMVTRAEYKKLK
ncbi:hypothetical protein Tco_1561237 [Tanacetum coccineum]